MNFSIISEVRTGRWYGGKGGGKCEIQYRITGNTVDNFLVFRKHFPLPWTAIWPMSKNSRGTSQFRGPFGTSCQLVVIYFTDWICSDGHFLYFISSGTALRISIYSQISFCSPEFVIGFQFHVCPVKDHLYPVRSASFIAVNSPFSVLRCQCELPRLPPAKNDNTQTSF